MHCFPNPILSARGRNYLQKEGREDLAVDLDTQTHASFVGEYPTCNRSVNSASSKHIKGLVLPQTRVSLPTPKIPIFAVTLTFLRLIRS